MRIIQPPPKPTPGKTTAQKFPNIDGFCSEVLQFYLNNNRYYHTHSHDSARSREPTNDKMDSAYQILRDIQAYRVGGQSEQIKQNLICSLNTFINTYPQVDTFHFCARCFMILGVYDSARDLFRTILDSVSLEMLTKENEWEILQILSASKQLIQKCTTPPHI